VEPIWLRVFRFVEGLQEVPGTVSNPVILKWNAAIGGPSWYDNDDKAWCALALNAVFHTCGFPLAGAGFDLLRAKFFATWGTALTVPTLGAVMVFERPEGAHVGLYLGERKDAYCIFGANQSNTVGIAWIAKKRLTAVRWPSGEAVPSTGRVWLNQNLEPVSNNEA